MIRYLPDSSALWRILRDAALRAAWADVIAVGAVASCQPQRTEFRRSARTVQEYEQMSGMFDELYPDAAVPKGAWRWIESTQYRLLRDGAHRSLSAIDLLICATAAHTTTWLCSMAATTSTPPPSVCPASGRGPSTTRHQPMISRARGGR